MYRIHGTNAPETIGQRVSSGCIRLTNEDVDDLFNRVTIGTKVVVLPDNGHVARKRRHRFASASRRPRPTMHRGRSPLSPTRPARRWRYGSAAARLY